MSQTIEEQRTDEPGEEELPPAAYTVPDCICAQVPRAVTEAR